MILCVQTEVKLTQDLFISVGRSESSIIRASISEISQSGVDWRKLEDLWLSALVSQPIPSEGWALFMSTQIDIPMAFDLFLLRPQEHPLWFPRSSLKSIIGSDNCAGWVEFSHHVNDFCESRPTDLPFGFGDEYEWFVQCVVNKIAIKVMQRLAWTPDYPLGNRFPSPNTYQTIHLSPLHSSGGHLFAATRGETYEDAINRSITYSGLTSYGS